MTATLNWLFQSYEHQLTAGLMETARLWDEIHSSRSDALLPHFRKVAAFGHNDGTLVNGKAFILRHRNRVFGMLIMENQFGSYAKHTGGLRHFGNDGKSLAFWCYFIKKFLCSHCQYWVFLRSLCLGNDFEFFEILGFLTIDFSNESGSGHVSPQLMSFNFQCSFKPLLKRHINKDYSGKRFCVVGNSIYKAASNPTSWKALR